MVHSLASFGALRADRKAAESTREPCAPDPVEAGVDNPRQTGRAKTPQFSKGFILLTLYETYRPRIT
jgi:hypothetical protein